MGSGYGHNWIHFWGWGTCWKTDLKLLKTATNWNGDHSSENNAYYSQTQLRDRTRCGMTRSEGNQGHNHVNGTLHRMMWQNCKILCKDVCHFVYGELKTYLWLVTINQMGEVAHPFSLPEQKQADSEPGSSGVLDTTDHPPCIGITAVLVHQSASTTNQHSVLATGP